MKVQQQAPGGASNTLPGGFKNDLPEEQLTMDEWSDVANVEVAIQNAFDDGDHSVALMLAEDTTERVLNAIESSARVAGHAVHFKLVEEEIRLTCIHRNEVARRLFAGSQGNLGDEILERIPLALVVGMFIILVLLLVYVLMW